MDFKYLFIDMNSFFASVEQQDRPELRGKPVAVTPYTGKTGCVIAASYEAKALGVTTGCRVGEAREKIPGIHIIEARARRYAQVHEKIKQALQDFSPWVEPHSIDEFSMVVDANDRREDAIYKLGIDVKRAINQKVGECIRSSVGIAPNVFLAKLGTDLMKPDGLVIIKSDEIRSVFSKIDNLTTICGINTATAARLQSRGVDTPLKLWQQTPAQLRLIFGVAGERWYRNLHGFDDASQGVDARYYDQLPKSVGHSYVLEPKLRNPQSARRVAHKLAIKVAIRLRQKNLVASQLCLGVRSFGSGGGQFAHRQVEPTNREIDIVKTALRLFERCAVDKPILISVTATRLGLCPYRQLSLLDPSDRAGDIETTVDNINQRFGPETIVAADLVNSDHIAPYRIAFNALDKPVTKR